jgi:hypothetical protein
MSTPSVEINSNTFYVYISVADAEIYFEGRLHTDAWDDATSTEQKKALVEATRYMENLNYSGEKASTTQELQFPRDDDTVIPTAVEECCAEIAFSLLDGIDPELEYENLGLKSIGVANARATYERQIIPEHILVGVPSARAWNLIRPYLRDARELTLSRVS